MATSFVPGPRVHPRLLLAFIAAAYVSLLAWGLTRQGPDFSAYWWGAHGFFSGTRPMYGDQSGMLWPMHYRYPPLFLILVSPFTWIPLAAGAKVWVVLEWLAVGATTFLAIRKWQLQFTPWTTLATLVLLGPHLLWSLKSGNVQGLLVAAVLAAFLWAEERPVLAGSLLAAAIAIKVWPVVLLPWFLRPERRRTLQVAIGVSAVLWLLPAAVLGADQYRWLLGEWFAQEFQAGVGGQEVWYPGQSLRGVLLRYFTDETRSLAPGEQYPDIHVAAFPLSWMSGLWIVLSAGLYGWTWWRAYRGERSRAYLWDAAGLVVFSALQPFAHKASLISLWPAILVAGHLLSTVPARAVRIGVLIAVAIAAIEIAWQNRYMLRLFEVAGLEFYLMLALLAGLLAATRRPVTD